MQQELRINDDCHETTWKMCSMIGAMAVKILQLKDSYRIHQIFKSHKPMKSVAWKKYICVDTTRFDLINYITVPMDGNPIFE